MDNDPTVPGAVQTQSNRLPPSQSVPLLGKHVCSRGDRVPPLVLVLGVYGVPLLVISGCISKQPLCSTWLGMSVELLVGSLQLGAGVRKVACTAALS